MPADLGREHGCGRVVGGEVVLGREDGWGRVVGEVVLGREDGCGRVVGGEVVLGSCSLAPISAEQRVHNIDCRNVCRCYLLSYTHTSAALSDATHIPRQPSLMLNTYPGSPP